MNCWWRLSFVFAILVGGLMGCAGQHTNPPPPTVAEKIASINSKQTYVLVHGAWAGGWEWKAMGQLLQADGYNVYRPTLTGQGERVHLASENVDLNTHINDVVNVILFENLHDIVLVGHSYGGMVITGVVDRVPDRIKAVVYVDAALPIDGERANDLFPRRPATRPASQASTSRSSATTQPSAATTQAWVNPAGWPYPPSRKPPYIVPMAANIFNTRISLKNPNARHVPTVYILTVDPGKKPSDDLFFKSYQRAKDRGWTVWTMEGDHVVHLTRQAELLKLLEKAPVEAKPAKN